MQTPMKLMAGQVTANECMLLFPNSHLHATSDCDLHVLGHTSEDCSIC